MTTHSIDPASNSGVWRRRASVSTFVRNAMWGVAALASALVVGAQHWTELQSKPSTGEVRAIVREEIESMADKIEQHTAKLQALGDIERERERSRRIQRYLVLHAQYMEAMIAAIAAHRPVPPRPHDLEQASQALLID